MTKEDALSLISQYCIQLKDRSEKDETMTGLRDRFPEDGSEGKAMRWLGFMQGFLYQKRICTLDELKEHSKTRHVTLREKENKATLVEFVDWIKSPAAMPYKGMMVAFDAVSRRVVVAAKEEDELENLLDEIDDGYRSKLVIAEVPSDG